MGHKTVAAQSVTATLTKKISSLIILVSLAPLIIVGGVFAHLYHTAYRDKTIAHLEELVSKHREIVNVHLRERLASIQTIIETTPEEKLGDSNFLKDLLYTLHSQYGRVFVDLGFVDDSGALLAYAGPFQLGDAQYAQAVWFKNAMAQEHYISDVFLGLRNQPHFIVAASRVFNKHRYILRATIDFEAFTRLVENIRIGETGHAFIINRQGDFQTQPQTDMTSCKEHLLDLVNSTLPEIPVMGTLLKFTEGRACPSDENAVFVLATLKQGEWVLIFEQTASEAFRDIATARWIVVSVMALGALAIIGMALLLSRRVVNYIAKLDEDKEKMNEQVVHASKMASLGEMAAGIAHEINNPVAVMIEEAGWVCDLLDDAASDGDFDETEVRRALGQIKTQGNRCKDITQKLLSFARKTDPDHIAINVNQQIQDTVELIASKARFANVQIATKLSPWPPCIQASATEMQQVLLNLLNNSLDAMEQEGGQISITTGIIDKMVDIVIKDNGPGIPDAILPKIFDPFFTTKPVGRGTGLGLAVCYGLIKNMHGDISVTSAVGQGTIFRVRLPQAAEPSFRTLAIKNTESTGHSGKFEGASR